MNRLNKVVLSCVLAGVCGMVFAQEDERPQGGRPPRGHGGQAECNLMSR